MMEDTRSNTIKSIILGQDIPPETGRALCCDKSEYQESKNHTAIYCKNCGTLIPLPQESKSDTHIHYHNYTTTFPIQGQTPYTPTPYTLPNVPWSTIGISTSSTTDYNTINPNANNNTLSLNTLQDLYGSFEAMYQRNAVRKDDYLSDFSLMSFQ